MIIDRELRIIPEPAPKTRAVVKPQNNYSGPLFLGKDGGNINYLCGSCHNTLAEAIWEDSIRNLVAQCCNCHTYNEFPPDPSSRFKNRVFLIIGTYNFSGTVILNYGKLIEGQSLGTGQVPLMTREEINSFLQTENIREPLSRDHILKIIKKNGGVTYGIDLSGRNLAGINLSKLDLTGIVLRDANLGPDGPQRPSIFHKTNFTASSLERAIFSGASMRGAILTSVMAEETDFRSCDLTEANFFGAKLFRTNLTNSILDQTQFNLAELHEVSLWGARLEAASFERAIWLEKYILGDERQSHKQAEEAHRNLRLWHQRAGLDNIAAEFRYRELVSKRKRAAEIVRISLKNRRLPEVLKEGIQLAPLVAAEALFGYGERWKRIILWWAGVILISALVYYFWSILVEPVFRDPASNSFADSIYYSVVSFTALGYGSWAPEPIGWVKYAGVVEAIMGPILVAMLITTFVRKWAR